MTLNVFQGKINSALASTTSTILTTEHTELEVQKEYYFH